MKDKAIVNNSIVHLTERCLNGIRGVNVEPKKVFRLGSPRYPRFMISFVIPKRFLNPHHGASRLHFVTVRAALDETRNKQRPREVEGDRKL